VWEVESLVDQSSVQVPRTEEKPIPHPFPRLELPAPMGINLFRRPRRASRSTAVRQCSQGWRPPYESNQSSSSFWVKMARYVLPPDSSSFSSV